MGSFFTIGLTHFLIVSFLLLAAGIATMLTKRNAIGILIGVELVLNAASINFVAFNRYGWPATQEPTMAAALAPAPANQGTAAPAAADAPAVADARNDAAPADAAPPATQEVAQASAAAPATVWRPAIDGQMFAIFIIVLAAAEAAVALAIFLNFYNNFSSIDVERADELKG